MVYTLSPELHSASWMADGNNISTGNIHLNSFENNTKTNFYAIKDISAVTIVYQIVTLGKEEKSTGLRTPPQSTYFKF